MVAAIASNPSNPTFGILHWCPYCGRPLQEGVAVCMPCGYVLGRDLGVMTAPRPFSKDDIFRQDRWVEPKVAMEHKGLPVSPWDGKVHSLVSSDGQWRWDGHRWIANWVPPRVEIPNNAVADTAKARSKGDTAGRVIVAILLGSAVLLLVLKLGGAGTSVSGTGTPSGETTYYLHYNCGGNADCIASTGAGRNTGIYASFSATGDNRRACEKGRIPFDRIGGAKSSWCSTSSNRGDTGP